MNVYTVEDWVTLDARPLAIFSTREKAEAFVAACAADGRDDMLIGEYVLDSVLEPIRPEPVAETAAVHAREPFDV